MKDRWSQLSMSEKSDLMSLYIQNGISSLEEIKKHYNSYQVGGPVSEKTPNFVQRFNEGNKRDIPFQGGHATHLLSYAERDGKYYVFPEVQPTDYNNSNSPLQYYGRDWRVAFDRAYDNNDYLEFDTEEAARNYSENYKKVPSTGAVLNGRNRGNYNVLDYMRGYATGGQMNSPDDPPKKPLFKQSQEQHYDRNNDIIYAQDSIGEGYQHEYFHARPDTTLLNNLRPYYENLNDNRLIELGADLPFVKRLDNDPNYFYSPEEIGARVSAARYMLNKAGINTIDIDFLRNARKNELQYGDNFRDLLHMYNDENLLQILNTQYSKGGHLYQDGGPDDDIAFTRTLAPVNIVEDAPEGVQVARRMLSFEKPYRNFMKAQDMDFYHRVKSTVFPIDCINTATRAITQDSTVGSNQSLFENPEKYGYVRVHPDSIHAGDLAQYVTWDDNLFPYHAGIVIEVPDEGVKIKSANGHGTMNPRRDYDSRVYADNGDTLMYYRYIGNRR